MKFKINLDYGIKYNEEEKTLTNSEVTENYIKWGVNTKYPDGLSGSLRRIIGRLYRKISDAIENDENEVDLEHAEFEIIERIIEDGKFPGNAAAYLLTLEDEVEKVKSEQKNKSSKKDAE